MTTHDIAIPQLPSRSIRKTLTFYGRLGFAVEAFPGPDYAIATRGSLEIHFFLHESLRPEESAFGCYLRVMDVDAIHKAFSTAGLPGKGIPRMDPIEDKPWGMREFAIVDEDGSLLRIGQAL